MTGTPHQDRAPLEIDAAAPRAAWFFERHGRMVYGLCRAMLRDLDDAEDATQQVFLSAYRALLGGARVRDSGAWLATIARNECRSRIAAAMRTRLPLADEDLEAIPAIGDEAEQRFRVHELRTALAELPERQREAVVLRYLYGLRYGEVATAMGLSRPAAEALLFRARRALRVRLRPVAGTMIAVPLAVREELALAIPGLAKPTGAGAAAAGAGGLFASLTASPVAAKVATAAVAVSTVGTVGAVESDRPRPDHFDRAPVVSVATPDSSAEDRSGPAGARRDDRSAADEDNRGHGSDEDSERSESSGRGGSELPGTEPTRTSGDPDDSSGHGGHGSGGDATRLSSDSSGPSGSAGLVDSSGSRASSSSGPSSPDEDLDGSSGSGPGDDPASEEP